MGAFFSVLSALVSAVPVARPERAQGHAVSSFVATVVVVLGLVAVVILGAQVFPEQLREMAR